MRQVGGIDVHDFGLEELFEDPPTVHHDDPDLLAAASLARGARLPELDPDDKPPPDIEASALDRLRSKLLRGDHALRRFRTPPALVEELLDRNTVAAMFGPSGGGKTFLTLDLALCVATGQTWHGRRVNSGRVLYVIAEGAHGFKARVDAWKEDRGVAVNVPEIFWLPDAVNLFDAEALALAELAAEVEPALIVLDTLSRCMVGADENTARDMSTVVDRLDRIRRATGACVLIVHHTGKNADAGLRGSSVLAGALDTILRLEGADGYLTLKVEKQKHRADGEQLRYRLRPRAESLIVETHDGFLDRGDLPESAVEVLRAIEDLDLGSGVAPSSIVGVTSVQRRMAYRHLKKLADMSLCVNVGGAKRTLWTLTDAGQEVVVRHRDNAVSSRVMTQGQQQCDTASSSLWDDALSQDTSQPLDTPPLEEPEEPF